MPRKVIAVVSLSSCLIISANWMDLSQSDSRRAIKTSQKKAWQVEHLHFTEKKVAMQISQLARLLRGVPCEKIA